MTVHFATKCLECLQIEYSFVIGKDLESFGDGIWVSPCDKCHDFPSVLYVTENNDEAEAYNQVISFLG